MATVTAGYSWVSGEVVTPAKMNLAAAPTVVVANNEVTTAKILDANVTNAKLASGIDASKLTTGTLPIARIANAAITAAKLNGAQTGSAPIYGCRAWVNFDGTTVTDVGGEDRCAIRASGNVSKVVRTATGAYTVHFATEMIDNNYAVFVTAKDDDPAVSGWTPFISDGSYATVLTTAAAKVKSYNVTAGARNTSVVCVQIFR
ncbi:MAG: hypothetical protein ACOYLL_14060 [Beijerinckiaceae bacterium]